jgi:hypothetical protein
MSPCAEISDLLVMKEGRIEREQLIGMLHIVRQAIADSEDFAGRIKKGV